MNLDFQNAEQELSGKISIDNHTTAREQLEIEATLEEWANFMCERNVNGVLSIYAENAINFDLMAPLQYEGVDTLRGRIEKWFNSFEGDIIVDIEDLHIQAEGHIGFAHCLIRFMGDKVGENEKGGEDMYNRATFGFEKMGNDWLIAHEHSSLPFDMQSGKILLDLRPAHH